MGEEVVEEEIKQDEREVGGHGPKDARIALVAEHPGPEELEHGFPLVGESGKLLNEMLARAGLYRQVRETLVQTTGASHFVKEVDSEIYITNLSKINPAPSFEAHYYENPKKRTPNQALLLATQRLKEELEALESLHLLLACGDHSLQALTGKRHISNWRGSILESSLLPGVKVIPIIHPAKTLREWYWRQLTILDLKKAKAQSAFKEIRRKNREFIVRPSLEVVLQVLESYRSSDFISFDIETKGSNIACVGLARSNEHGICVPFISDGSNYWDTRDAEAAAWLAIAKVLEGPAKKIAQNVLFDASHLAAHGIQVTNIYWDTMLAQSILYPELEKSLAVLCSIYTDEPYYKADGRAALKLKSDKAWAPGQADEQLWIYNLKDCCITFEVFEEQLKDFEELSKGRRRTSA